MIDLFVGRTRSGGKDHLLRAGRHTAFCGTEVLKIGRRFKVATKLTCGSCIRAYGIRHGKRTGIETDMNRLENRIEALEGVVARIESKNARLRDSNERLRARVRNCGQRRIRCDEGDTDALAPELT